MAAPEFLVEQFRRRLAAWLLLRNAVAAATLWVFLWGTAVLVVRAAASTPLAYLLWGAVGIPIALFAAWRIARRRVPPAATVRALLDHRGGCGGLLMAGGEAALGDWSARMPTFELPQVRWNARRPLALFAAGIGYLLLAFLLPSLLESNQFDIDRQTDRLTEQVRVLQEEKILSPERAETLAKRLEEIRSNAGGKEPGKTLEALDHLQESVRQAASQAAEAAARRASDLGKVKAGAQALQQSTSVLEAKDLAARMKELAKMGEKAAADSEAMNEALDPDLKRALQEGRLTQKQLDELSRAAQEGRDEIKKAARKLAKSRLISPEQLKACEGGELDGKSLSDFLNKHREKSLKQALEKQMGRGGVSEDGPGLTPLTFGDPSTEAGAKFREEMLPPGTRSALQQSQVVGVGSAAPQRDPKAGPPRTGSLNGAGAGGGSANSAAVLPQHKAAVGRYFQRTEK